MRLKSGLAALRDFDPVFVGLGAFSSKAAEAVRACISATAPKADVTRRLGFRRLVPQADIDQALISTRVVTVES